MVCAEPKATICIGLRRLLLASYYMTVNRSTQLGNLFQRVHVSVENKKVIARSAKQNDY